MKSSIVLNNQFNFIYDSSFTKVIQLEEMKDKVLARETKDTSLKELTLSLLESTMNFDEDAFAKIAACVDKWGDENGIIPSIQKDIRFYCVNNEDIIKAMMRETTAGFEIVLVMKDSTKDSVFEHNNFCFDLAEKYNDIVDFMVIDIEEEEGSHDLIKQYELIC